MVSIIDSVEKSSSIIDSVIGVRAVFERAI
jgi:hypothetical protein